MGRENIRAGLIANIQLIPKPLTDQKNRRLSFALKQSIGRDSRAHTH